jgi:hypothetical protein
VKGVAGTSDDAKITAASKRAECFKLAFTGEYIYCISAAE